MPSQRKFKLFHSISNHGPLDLFVVVHQGASDFQVSFISLSLRLKLKVKVNFILSAGKGSTTPTQYVVNTLYWPHTALSVYRVCYFLVPHTHVLCMGSGSATGKKIQVRLVHSLLKYFFKFQLWYWIQIYTTKYSNLLLIILILVWIVCSTYRKGEILMQKWHVTSQFVYCYMPY